MADRNFQKKKRNEIKRKTKPIMLITAEGKNKTEKSARLFLAYVVKKCGIDFTFDIIYYYKISDLI